MTRGISHARRALKVPGGEFSPSAIHNRFGFCTLHLLTRRNCARIRITTRIVRRRATLPHPKVNQRAAIAAL